MGFEKRKGIRTRNNSMKKNDYNKALNIARSAHAGQVDKGGQDYINHSIKIASMVKRTDEKIVAVLHDVCEDSETTLKDLRKLGFSRKIVKAVDAITKREGERYRDYIKRVSRNRIARVVKIADSTHNSDISRIARPTESDIRRCAKYSETIDRLNELI